MLSKKWVLLLVCLLVSVSALSAQEATDEIDSDGPWMVCDIAVDGLKNIRKRTVTKAAHAKKGDLYDRYTVNEDIQENSDEDNK